MTETKQPRHTVRRVVAVLGGLLFIVVITTATDLVLHATGIYAPLGQPMADSLFLVALAYRIVFGIAGGYITGRLAPDRPVTHALVLGIIGLVLSIAGTLATWNRGPEFGPKWYAIAVVVIAIPCAWIGGKLVRR